MASTVYYNRGSLQAALAVEAIRNALQAKPGTTITGDDVKKGFEHIKDFTLGGLVPPLAVTPENHEGGGWVQVCQVKGREAGPRDRLVQGVPGRHRAPPEGAARRMTRRSLTGISRRVALRRRGVSPPSSAAQFGRSRA